MSGNEIHELAVRISPEGAEETQQSLEGVSGQFEDTAQTAEEQGGKLADFAEEWRGAFGVIAAGLAVGVAALAANVPILGELFSGLTAVVDSLALAMDSVLRPVLTPLSNAMFKLSSAIDQAPEPIRKLIGLLTSFATAAVVASGALRLMTGSGLIEFLSSLPKKLAAARASLASFASSAAVVGGAALVLAGAIGAVSSEMLGIGTNTRMSNDALMSFKGLAADIGFIIGGLVFGSFKAIVQLLKGDVPGAFKTAKKFAREWAKASARFAARVQAGFLALGQSLRTIFETTFAVLRSVAAKAINNMIRKIEEFINRAIQAANRVSDVTGITLDKVDLGEVQRKSVDEIISNQKTKGAGRLQDVGTRGRRQILANAPGSGGGGGGGGTSNRFAEGTNVNVNIEGEGLKEAISVEQDQETANRGR